MRRLALHTSALSDAEYELYTSSLKDLAFSEDDAHDRGEGHEGGRDGDSSRKGSDGDSSRKGREDDKPDEELERMVMSVREARAWLRGRYGGVGAGVIDSILRLFSPSLSQADTITGAEFFAALRLVVHAENGREVDRALAFVQATPSRARSGSAKTSVPTQAPHNDRPTPSTSQASSPAKRPSDLPPPMPSRRVYNDTSMPATPSASASSSKATSAEHNPFASSDPHSHSQPQAYPHPQPPLHPSRSESSRSVTGSATGTTPSRHSAHNPFVVQRQDELASKSPPSLPPRKPPPLVPPPRHASSRDTTRVARSISPSKQAPSSQPAKHPNPPTVPAKPALPPIPTKPPHHITSSLIQQSLQASKLAQSMKRAEEQLEKERVLQVLKSSSVVTGSYSLAGARLSGSSVVIGTNIHSQHQGQQQPQQTMGQGMGAQPQFPTRGTSPTAQRRVYAPAPSSASSASASDGAPPLPRRRQQHQQSQSQSYSHSHSHPSPPLSASSLEQVALAAPPPPLLPPSRGYGRTNSNPDRPARSPFHSASEESPSPDYDYDGSPSRAPNVDLPAGPPPTHPDRKGYGYFPYHAPSTSTSSHPSSHSHSQAQRSENLESFEAIYGPMSSTPSPSTPLPPSPLNRVFRSKSMHQTSPPVPPLPPPTRRRRPESVQVLGSGEVLRNEPVSPGLGKPTSTLSRHASLSTPHRRSSLSITSTPTHPNSHSQNHTTSASTSSTHSHQNPNKNDPFTSHSTPAQPTPSQNTHNDPFSLSHIQRTLATLQPKLENLNTNVIKPGMDRARYKAEAGLSKRGFVRDRHLSRGEEGEGLMGDERERDRGFGHGEERRYAGQGEGTRGEGSGGMGRRGDSPEVDYEYMPDSDSDSEGDGDGWRRGRGMGINLASPMRVRSGGSEEGYEEGLEYRGREREREREEKERRGRDGGEKNVFGTPEGGRSPVEFGGGGVFGGGERERGRGGRGGRESLEERDNLKWPAGEGWAPL